MEIPRARLRNHLADLDVLYDELAPANPLAARLLDGVLCDMHPRVFGHLPRGEAGSTSS